MLNAPSGAADRVAALASLAADQFDVLVIGGGITGAGVAREAALRGLRTALVERDDFAAGTSSRSSRLVHGGVRYLEHGHLALVFESSHERRVLLEMAPHLVRPLAFTWPVYRGARVPGWKVRAGLLLYDALALFRNVQRHEGLSAVGVLDHEPGLSDDGLLGGARYWDAATDDTRLTLATVLGAIEHGATAVNHCAVVGGVRTTAGRLEGLVVEDRLVGERVTVRARVIINATGPWSDATAALTGEAAGTQVLGSAGTHIAVPRDRVGNHDAITIVSPVDGRVMFALPSGTHTIIGTTERPASRGPDEIRATRSEVTYLLNTVNRIFPRAALRDDDVVSAWCGIRPLAVARAGKQSANAASREHAIAVRADGLVSVTGGKLTTYRAMAIDVLRRALSSTALPAVDARAGKPSRTYDSEHVPLPGGDFTSRESLLADARTATHDAERGERLMHAYGSQWRRVWQYAVMDATLAQRIADDLPYMMAEVVHAVHHEMACTLSDVLIRRTHVAFETRDHGRSAARRIAPVMAGLLQWSDARAAQMLEAYDADAARLFTIEDR